MKITPTLDLYSLPRKQGQIRYIGSKWIEDFARQVQKEDFRNLRSLILDISNVEFITLFEWAGLMAYLERLLINAQSLTELMIDAKGENDLRIIPSHDFIRNIKGEMIPFSPEEIDESKRLYKVLGFIESVGGLSGLSHPETRLGYRWMDKASAALRAFYSQKPDSPDRPTILFPLRRIESKEHCRAFVMDRPFGSWREAMAERFREASVFWSEEFWRVLCYELSANIWEHAGLTGFLSARIVEPCYQSQIANKAEFLHRWQLTYGDLIDDEQMEWMKNGLLEIVVADCGNGLVSTLKDTYTKIHEIDGSTPVTAKDVLCFAFDELGTSKEMDDHWATARHALSRVLRIVGKYGGSLRLRSAGHEIVYRGKSINSFRRSRDKKGIAPTADRRFDSFIPGTQMQILLPLYIPDRSSAIITHRSVLETALPNSYKIDPVHPIGHLVPLLEELNQPNPWVGEEEAHVFRKACERLCRRLLERRRDEAIILDFSYLKWTTEQFETLLHLLQNVLQHRPALLIELDPQLAAQVVALEEVMADTQICSLFSDKSSGFAGKGICELGVRNYLETYRGIHAILLGLDTNGKPIIFGLPSRNCEKPLLDLIYHTQTAEGLCQSYALTGADEYQLKAVLNGPNQIFVKREDGPWECLWDEFMLAAQHRRSLARHFDDVAENCGAWRGRKKRPPRVPPPVWHQDSDFQPFSEFPETQSDTGEELYYLPWAREWRKEFLECALILSRERYADEVARRLIFRLDRLLKTSGHSLRDIKTIACVTAPSMLLTEAIHRCWPIEYPAPTIADLGHYILLGFDIKMPPRLLGSGGIVIVQDVMDKQNVTEKLLIYLQEQTQMAGEQNQFADGKILAQISFVRLSDPELLKETRSTGIDESWIIRTQTGNEVLCHSMIEVPRPPSGMQPDILKENSKLFWIEPRSLRPFRYSRLRTETPESDPLQKRRKSCLQSFDDPAIGPLFSAGHYVYGNRHYSVVVDIPRLARSTIGGQIASDLAAICEGDRPRSLAVWERKEGQSLKGDVTGVLMPLHSQIHHLWPKVEAILAQHGRRQPAWYLDATLLYGSGPSYRMPEQLVYQVRTVAESLRNIRTKRKVTDSDKIRILILDDAMISGRTGETIIANLMRLISEATKRGEYPSPVEWIRYFAILNQCTYARNELYQNMTTLGGELGVKILFEAFAPFMGVKTYDSDNCPSCKSYKRLSRLRRVSEAQYAHATTHWIDKKLWGLYPIAVDGFDFHRKPRPTLPKALDILPALQGSSTIYTPRYADTAIWQLQELMYLNQPPSMVLTALAGAFPEDEREEGTNPSEYERYRWAVLDWCIRNWTLVEFDRAESIFFQCTREEVNRNTPLVPSILEALSTLHRNEHVRQFIHFCIAELARLEQETSASIDFSESVQRALNLDLSLTLFFLAVPSEELSNEENDRADYISILNDTLSNIEGNHLSHLRNLQLRLSRDHRFPRPDWALSVIGEAVFRGAKARSKPVHPLLLPRVLQDVAVNPTDPLKRRILEGSLGAFLAAVDDLAAYSPLSCLSTWAKKGKSVMDWLRIRPDDLSASDLPEGYDIFRESLDHHRKWCLDFNAAFHPSLSEIKELVASRAEDLKRTSKNRWVELVWLMADDDAQCRILTHVSHLVECMVNLAINPIRESPCNEQLHTAVRVSKGISRLSDKRRVICLTLLTKFRAFRAANEHITSGQHIAADIKFLEPFGVSMQGPRIPEECYTAQGYTTAIDFFVPIGFSIFERRAENDT